MNTLYYHFENIGEVTRRALDGNLDPELSAAILAGGFFGRSLGAGVAQTMRELRRI